jgi:tRNA threonylcarbamoyladenosine biosynthesis protein TsaB
MRILALETSGRDGSLAALEGNQRGVVRLVREATVVGPERTAQFLAPRLQELLHDVRWEASAIELITVAVGPGSFTGLRIGVTTAKALAYATGAQVIGVNTLAVIAEQAPAECRSLWVVMDAQRQELFAAKFGSDRKLLCEPLLLPQQLWPAALKPGDSVSGPGLRRLRVDLPDDVHIVDESRWQPMATAVGQLGWRDYTAGRRDDLWTLAPQYYRQSAAEEKRDKFIEGKENGRQGDKENR